jgi:spermidine/putrescine transport system substrate-binding protein
MVYQDELKALSGFNNNDEITEILNRTSQIDIDKVGEKLNLLKPMLYGFEVDSGKNDIVLGNIDAYVAWSGDAAYAIDVASGEVEDEDGSFVEDTKSLSYYIPDEGSNIWFDGLVMPSGSNNYDAVYKFLSFISRPENVIRNMDYIGYTSMIATDEIYEEIVLGWFDESEDLEEGEGVEVDLSYFFGEGDYKVIVSEECYGRLLAQYPTHSIAERCAVMNYFDNDTLMNVNEMWEGVKGETFPLWLIILIASLVVLFAILLVLNRNKDKIKWFKLPERKTTYAERKGLKIIKIEDIK